MSGDGVITDMRESERRKSSLLLDIKTALMMWGTQALTLAVLLATIWLKDRRQRPYLWNAIGFGLHGSGIVLAALGVHAGEAWMIFLRNFMLLAGFSFWITALRQMDGRRFAASALLPPLLWLVLTAAPAVREQFGYRLMAQQLATAVGFAVLATTVVTARFSSQLYRWLLTGLWTLQSVIGLGVALFCAIYQPAAITAVPYIVALGVFSMVALISAMVVLAKIVMDANERRLSRLSRIDPLTGILNRRGLVHALESGRLRNHRDGHKDGSRDGLTALMIFDLDYFKNINDTFGHQAGDTVLASFAGMAGGVLGRGCILARSGGEEFAAVIAVADLRQAAQVAEDIRQMVAVTPVVTDRGVVRFTTSIGIAALPSGKFDFDSAMREADNALYKAKAEGRNRTAIARDGHIVLVTRGDERGASGLIDTEADLQVAALRRLSQRSPFPSP